MAVPKNSGGAQQLASFIMRWYVYVLRSLKNGTLYVGRTDDVSRRLQEHNAGKGGFYTSQNRPYELMYFEMFLNTRDACAEERFLKAAMDGKS
ncbi:MAG: GIY-YIG nuclease family protein [Candidatus Kerfeldbacteria bacterium]|nr:GIY-YIG nuclease family protein [Candidatus Kerfeldbacteria bacterium]